MLISSVYNDVALDNVNTSENGQLSFSMFNRVSQRAELRMLDYLSGDIENLKMPIPYVSEKLKDVIAFLITKYPSQITNGIITKPKNFYSFENLYLLGIFNEENKCYEIIEDNGVKCNTTIQLLDGSKFTERCSTYIEGLQPSFKKPISKVVGNTIEFNPYDLGNCVLEYIRYPVFGKIVTKFDEQYHEEVIDEEKSLNYEWPEFARELLVFWISQMFAIHTREQALVQNNIIYGKLERDAK